MSPLIRRMFALIAVLILLIPLFAACGGNTATNTPETASATDVLATEVPATGGEVTAAPTEAVAEPTSAPTEGATESTEAPTEPATSSGTDMDKTIIIGMNQFPDTMFWPESQSLATVQVIEAIQPVCISNLNYDYQAVCFTEVPSFETGSATINTVTVNAAYTGSIVLNDELITDTSTLTGPLELSQIQTTWTLRDGLMWEDGTPVTADDFIFAFEVGNNPDVQITTRFTNERTARIEKVDDKTFTWVGVPGFSDATYFLNFAGSIGGPLPKHVMDGQSIDDWRAMRPLAYGPYKVAEDVPQESTTLVANDTYWRADEGLPKVGNIVFKYLTSEDQMLQQLDGGEVDVTLSGIGLTVAQAPQLDQMEADGKIKAQYVAGTSWDHLDFGIIRGDDATPFFDDVKVRQALAYGINRQEIVDEILFGKSPIMNSILPAEHWAYPPNGDGLETYEYNPDRAGQLLDEAGWTLDSDGIRAKNGRKFSGVQFYTTESNATRQSIAQIIQENLKQLGIEVELIFVPGTAVLFKNGEDGILASHRFDLALYGFTSSSDPNMNLYLCSEIPLPENSYAGQNNPGYCSDEFDKAALAANGDPNRATRIPLVIEAQQIVNRDLPTLPLYQKTKVGASRSNVSGFQLDPTHQYDTYNIAEWDIAE